MAQISQLLNHNGINASQRQHLNQNAFSSHLNIQSQCFSS